MTDPILSIRQLSVDYITETGAVRALDSVSLDVQKGEFVGIAGESGSGKSTLAHAVLRILPPPAVISGGSVIFEGRDILSLPESELQSLRWKRLSIVFQSAMDSLNPVITIGEQMTDVMVAHTTSGARAARERARDLLDMVGLRADVVNAYAHHLSGGMRQRVNIALALALQPSVVILDEPTTALDVVVERDILEHVRELQRQLGFAVLFITHDIARMVQFSDRIAVFYAAQLVEVGRAADIAQSPRHPYALGLLRAFPSVLGDVQEYASIPGSPPSVRMPPPGCRFHPRCSFAVDRCRTERPALTALGPDSSASCHRALDLGPLDVHIAKSR